MSPVFLIVLTAALIVIRVVRLSIGPTGDAVAVASRGRHPLILLIGSLISLMALYSLVRYVPMDARNTWPVFFHVGFVCLWLLLLIAPGGTREPSAQDAASGH